jgi:hypothetical protein
MVVYDSYAAVLRNRFDGFDHDGFLDATQSEVRDCDVQALLRPVDDSASLPAMSRLL